MQFKPFAAGESVCFERHSDEIMHNVCLALSLFLLPRLKSLSCLVWIYLLPEEINERNVLLYLTTVTASCSWLSSNRHVNYHQNIQTPAFMVSEKPLKADSMHTSFHNMLRLAN